MRPGTDDAENFQDGGQDGLYPRIEIVCTSPRFYSNDQIFKTRKVHKDKNVYQESMI